MMLRGHETVPFWEREGVEKVKRRRKRRRKRRDIGAIEGVGGGACD